MGDLKKVIACIKEAGRKPKIESFEDKLVVQKTVCLLEMLGFDMGYRFSLYVRGPYSPDLTNDLYSNKTVFENLKSDYFISAKEKEMLANVIEASDNLDPVLLEIMATYAFLKKSGLQSKEAIAKLKKLKPFFSQAKIVVGISRTKQLFPPSEKEIEDMKKEFAEIESASVSDMRF